jgi:hypothetical protein
MTQLPSPIARLTSETKISELIEAYPFLIEELGNFNPHYTALRDPAMREMMAKHATLGIAAERGGVKLKDIMNFIANTVQRVAGHALLVDAPLTFEVDRERLEAYRTIMIALHKGGDIKEAERKFAQLVKSASPGEIAEMEQYLIREGMPVSEIKRMCDVHLQVVNPSLKKVDFDVPDGHPIRTFLAENSLISEVVTRLQTILDITDGKPDPNIHAEAWKELKTYVSKLAEINKHYLRKEHQLFSFLEKKGFTGPSQVMWAVHDDIRGMLKQVNKSCESGDAVAVEKILPSLLTSVQSMIQKEESILFPTALQLLDESDWKVIKSGESEIGYMEALSPGDDWEPLTFVQQPKYNTEDGLLSMNMGELTLEQINLILVHLPVELSFVDENDEVRFYSNQPHKIFPRTPDSIGRKVQNCHPPKSVHLVNRILSDFRSGKRDVAEFWIEMAGMFVYIRYFAIRAADGSYRGSLEVVQDIAKIRGISGERRLLEEEKA